MIWTPEMNNSSQKATLNAQNQYASIDSSVDGRRFCMAGVLPEIEVYDLERLKLF